MSTPAWKKRPLSERLWEKIERRGPDECWPWKGCVDDHGYGVINEGGRGRALKAHRVVAALSNIDTTRFILHSCDNPLCCNPAHLRAGTQKENIADMYARGRSGVIGSRHPGSRLTEQSVAEILLLAQRGVKQGDLARAYGVCQQTISHVVRRTTWKHVQPGNAVSSPVATMLGSAVAEALMVA